MAPRIIKKKSKPMTPTPVSQHMIPPKSPERTGSRSSTSASSNVSRSSRPRSSRSRNVMQDNTTTITTTIATTTTSAAAAISSKRLVRKGLDVSPAMLEFFGMESVVGSKACFQLIEERELPPSRKNKRYRELRGSNNILATTGGNSGVDQSDEMAENRDVREYVKDLSEPGPEHLPGIETGREMIDDLYMEDNEAKIMIEKEEVELGRMKSSKLREEIKRLAKSGLSQTYEPGPEYFSSTAGNDEDGGNEIKDEILEKECASNSLSILAVRTHAVGATCSNIAKGGGIGGGPSMTVTTNATADAMRSSVGEVAAVAVTALAATAVTTTVTTMTATTTTTIPVTAMSMGSGNGSTVGAILIKAAQIINDDSICVADVLIRDGIIQ